MTRVQETLLIKCIQTAFGGKSTCRRCTRPTAGTTATVLIVDQARRETDIRREDTSRRMLSELSHANSKKESLERQLRRAAEDGKEAASRLAEIETDAARDKARMGEEIRALKRRLRSAEVAEQGSKLRCLTGRSLLPRRLTATVRALLI